MKVVKLWVIITELTQLQNRDRSIIWSILKKKNVLWEFFFGIFLF